MQKVSAKIQAVIKKLHVSACYLQIWMKPKQADMEGVLRT